jgi:hypothetical protein
MSVIHHLTVAPRDGGAPDPERFVALLAELMESGVVDLQSEFRDPHVLVLAGDVGGRADPFSIGIEASHAMQPGGPRPSRLADRVAHDFDFTVLHAGSDPGEILAAARSALNGGQDVCVFFMAQHPDHGHRCDAALYSTRAPHALVHAEPFYLSRSGTLFSYKVLTVRTPPGIRTVAASPPLTSPSGSTASSGSLRRA